MRSERGRLRLNPAIVISVLALVLALVGGAVASSGGGGGDNAKATASAKGKQGPRGKQGKPGKPGKEGKQGPAGTAGAQGGVGPAGPQGPKGDPGSAGGQGKQGPTGPTGTGTTGNRGPTGPTGPQGPLEPGVTETGVWNVGMTPSGTFNPVIAPLSFSLQLPGELGATEVHYINEAGKELPGEGISTACLGDVAAPSAEPGHLCVYEALNPFMTFKGIRKADSSEASGASVAGALVEFESPEEARAWGTWAVTAPAAP